MPPRSPMFDAGMKIFKVGPETYRRPGPTLGTTTPTERQRPHSLAEHMWDRILDQKPDRQRPYQQRGRPCAIVSCRGCGRMCLVLVREGQGDPVVRSCPVCVSPTVR